MYSDSIIPDSTTAMKSYDLLALAAIVLTAKSQDNEVEKGSNCHNPCSPQLVHMSCKNEGSCIFDPGACTFTCTCVEGFTGQRCEVESSSTPPDRSCRNDRLPCINGKCLVNNETETEMCICDDGWTGTLCGNKSTLLEPPNNSCSTDYMERSYAKRTCNGLLRGQECNFGKCQKELVVRGQGHSWGGYSFSCECDDGAQGTWCEHKCCLDCGDHGACTIGNSTQEGLFCDCKPNYDGERCEEFIPEPMRLQLKENNWYLYVVGACAIAFFVLVTMAIIVPYMMWKHRVILILKIVHYFKAYEDEDEREWDAFVSYKADEVDEHFVVHTLYPMLEKQMGFKLCLHFRDFVPGETIANNIINAVEGSRRTILILTPRYVESEFTRFEYEKAQQEMLRRKHRVIPLVLEDISHISSTMDVTLKNIVESVTYIEWPQSETDFSKKMDKFWKRLHLSMPKRKDNVKSSSVSSSNNSNVNQLNGLKNVQDKGFPDSGFQQSSYARMNSYELTVCNKISNCMETTKEMEDTIYSEITEVDESLTETIATLSEQQEAALTNTTEKFMS